MHGGEGEIFDAAMVLLTPQIEKPAVAQGQIIGRGHAQVGGGAINPFGRALKLGVVTDGRFIDDAVALAVLPLGAPFLVAERGHQSQRTEDLGQGVAVGNFGFSFDAMFMAIFGRTVARQALVRQCPSSCVTANAKNLGPGAQSPVRCVVEGVGLEGARGEHAEARGGKALGKSDEIGDAEFDLGFDGHRYQRV